MAGPDHDTLVLDIDDQELARQVLRFRAEVSLRNGSLAHRHAGLLAARGVRDITVEARILVVRDPAAVANVMALRTCAHAAAARGHLDPADADRFVAQFDDAVHAGRFTYAVTFFLTAGMLPLPDKPRNPVAPADDRDVTPPVPSGHGSADTSRHAQRPAGSVPRSAQGPRRPRRPGRARTGTLPCWRGRS